MTGDGGVEEINAGQTKSRMYHWQIDREGTISESKTDLAKF